jgi:uncharacterized protein (DUF924 family)
VPSPTAPTQSVSAAGAPARAPEILDFWFGPLDDQGRASPEHQRRWWQKDEAFDREIATRFGGLHATLLAGTAGGEFALWRAGPESLLAYVIVLDQFSRNMFRGSAGMYAGDELALAAAFEGIALGYGVRLPRDMRVFLYMPLMHSERVEVQRRCVELFDALAEAEQAEGAGESSASNADYARRHLEIVERFGRFPHRNELLGRPSTAEEVEFLKQPNSSF